MIRLALFWGLLAFATVIDASSSFDDEDWTVTSSPGMGTSAIVDAKREELLTGIFPNTQTVFRAEVLVVLLRSGYQQTVDALAKTVNASVGLSSVIAIDDVSFDSAWKTIRDGPASWVEKQRATWESALQSAGIHHEALHSTRGSTSHYNAVPQRDGYSVTKFLVFDGRELFDVSSCTVLIVYRTDRVNQWGLMSIHDPFSLRYDKSTLRLVTKTELGLVERLGEELKMRPKWRVLPYAESWFTEVNLWLDLKRDCEAP